MRTLPIWFVTAAACALPLVAAAHTGGALDAEGCHADHRKGTYHCHRGEAAGYTFPNRAAMQEAVKTGNFPEKSVDEEGFFEKLWPWGKKHEQQETAPDAATTASDASGGPAPSGPAVAPAGDAAPASAGTVAAALPPEEGSSAAAPAAPPAAPAASPAPAAPQNEYERRLKVLQGLYEMGLITREEYEAKRKEVLGQL